EGGGGDGGGGVADGRGGRRGELHAEPFALRAPSVRRVEREEARLERRRLRAAARARARRRVGLVLALPLGVGQDDLALREAEARLERLAQPPRPRGVALTAAPTLPPPTSLA